MLEATWADRLAEFAGGLAGALREGEASREAAVEALARALTDVELHDLALQLHDRDRIQRGMARSARVCSARLAFARGDLPGARREAEAAIHVDFTDVEAHRTLAEAFERLGDGARAHTHYSLAFHLGPGTSDPRGRGRAG